MAKKYGLSWGKISSLADLQSAVRASLVEMVDLVKELLHEEPYSKEEVRQFCHFGYEVVWDHILRLLAVMPGK
jgi:hypothetical protein